MNSPLLSTVLPTLARELQELLIKQGEPALAAQVPSMTLVDRCRCGEESCAMFYTVPRPITPWGAEHRNVVLDAMTGMLVLDVVSGVVVAVEVLDRPAVRRKVHNLLP